MIEIILIISILLNIVFLTYSIKCARRLLIVGSNFYFLEEKFTLFQAHVETLHESEMYYGDQSLLVLVEHTKEILKELEKYEDIYTLVIDDDEEEEEYEEEGLNFGKISENASTEN